jgi:hypothetical protein
MPQTPWPEVQPFASRVPRPTSSPATTTTARVRRDVGGQVGPDRQRQRRPAQITSPAMKGQTFGQRCPSPERSTSPPRMPLAPMIRPLTSRKSAAAQADDQPSGEAPDPVLFDHVQPFRVLQIRSAPGRLKTHIADSGYITSFECEEIAQVAGQGAAPADQPRTMPMTTIISPNTASISAARLIITARCSRARRVALSSRRAARAG